MWELRAQLRDFPGLPDVLSEEDVALAAKECCATRAVRGGLGKQITCQVAPALTGLSK